MGYFKLSIISSLATVLALSSTTMAQLSGGPVGQDSGPVRERSTNVGTGSGPVRESGGSVHDGNAGRLSGNSVRGSVTGDLRSGPVSDVSAGPVTSRNPVFGGGSVTEGSTGAVSKDASSPIREGIARPVQELGGLLQQLRAIQPLPREGVPPEEEPEEPAVEVPTPEEQTEEDTTQQVPEPPEANAQAAPESDATPAEDAGQEPPAPAEQTSGAQ
jgi:hypothetical protein